MNLSLSGLTEEQCRIADILWACESQEEANEAVENGGIEFAKIRDLMLASAFDDVQHINDAQKVLSKFLK